MPGAAGQPMGQPGAGGSLDFMRQNPQFQQLKAVIQSNPQMLGPILQ